MNTNFNNKSLRLSFFKLTDSREFLIKRENELFNKFLRLIKVHLVDIGEIGSLEEFLPLNYLIKNRLNFGNIEAFEVYFGNYLYPFLEEIQFKNLNKDDIFRNLLNCWREIFRYNNNDNLQLLLSTKNIITDNLPKYLIKNYNISGIDTVLMGLTKKDYIDDIFK